MKNICKYCKKIKNKKNKKYCSRKCLYIDMVGHKVSDKTREKFSIYSKSKIPWNKDKKCPQLSGENSNNWKGGEITKKCLICRKKFKIRPSQVAYGWGKFCSRKCNGKWKSENLRGKNCQFYIDGKTPINELIRKSSQYLEWAKIIKERDDFICQICKIKGGKLRSNHIKKFSDYPELRFDLNNGITICEGCDLKLVFWNEENCEDFFNFNLIERGYL